MLSLLHLCADAGIVVTSYTDNASGTMTESGDGSGQFTEVMLNPSMVITDSGRIDDAVTLHAKAHALCFIARSVNFPVSHNPSVTSSIT
jgi:organic hydroperoxide reductase OsmC/OhrA